MAQAGTQELVDRFEGFYREYYREEIGQLAQRYPNEQRSLHVDWGDLYRFDRDIAEDYLAQPDQLREYAEEALRLYDLPVDVSLGQAHVRIRALPETTEIREIRSRDVNSLVAVQGIIRKATDVRPKVQEAAFECQRCGTLTYIPQTGGFQEPHQCQGCERQGPFQINYDQSTFVDAQKLRVQESPEGLRGGETPQSIDIHIEDDVTGEVSPGDHVTVTGVLRIEQQESQGQKSRMFDVFMDGHSLVVEDEEFEEMDITADDKREIVELSRREDIYEQMVASIAPTIFGYEGTKLAMTLQLFSGVTKHLPDGSRIRGDMHMLLIGDPGTGKCVDGDTRVALADGRTVPIRELVESNLHDPKPVDDGIYDQVDIPLPSMEPDGTMATRRATRVWKREAPDRMYRIRTAAGRELEVTPSHPLFVRAGEGFEPRTAAELREGAYVAAPRRLEDGGLTPAGSAADAGSDGIPGVAETLRTIRDRLALSSFECGLPRSTYREYECGDRLPSRLDLRRITEAFRKQLRWLRRTGDRIEAGDWPEIEALRPDLGLSREALAAGMGVDRSDVDYYERTEVRPDGGRTAAAKAVVLERIEDALEARGAVERLAALASSDLRWDRIVGIEPVEPTDDWVYDLEVAGTHSYVANGVVSHNSQLLQYIRNIAPRSVYTSGKGSSTAGLTAAAVRDDFGDGQQWSLEAGALVLADKGIAAVDELDKMAPDDRSAMHEALEQQSISISKAGINATLKARCSLLGAANPKYGRFDQYEPIAEQIDLEPALVSRFDLIFTVTDKPDADRDGRLADHILMTNYAGELSTQRAQLATPNATEQQVEEASANVQPAIEPDLFRKYIAYAKRNTFPTMTDEARAKIREFYVDLRSRGAEEDSPVPITARKLEALVRLAEASARVRLSDSVEPEDAERVIDIVRASLQDIGVDPETGQFDADVIETGTSKTQRDRIKSIRTLIAEIEDDYEAGAPIDEVLARAAEVGIDESKAEHEIEKLRQRGEVYEPQNDHLRTT